jgi:hypothetical protein
MRALIFTTEASSSFGPDVIFFNPWKKFLTEFWAVFENLLDKKQ